MIGLGIEKILFLLFLMRIEIKTLSSLIRIMNQHPELLLEV